MRAPLASALGIIAAGALLAASAPAQVVPPASEPGHVWRALAVGDLALPARWRPSLTGGGLVQVSLRPTRVSTEEGFEVVRPPAWYLHGMATLGVSFDEDGDGDAGLGASLALGLLRRVDPTPISAAGAVVERRWGPGGFAPAARVELLDNVGAQLGWIFVAGGDGDDGLFLSLDGMRCLLADLGLGPCLP